MRQAVLDAGSRRAALPRSLRGRCATRTGHLVGPRSARCIRASGAQPQDSADRSLAKIGTSFQTPFSPALATVIQVGW